MFCQLPLPRHLPTAYNLELSFDGKAFVVGTGFGRRIVPVRTPEPRRQAVIAFRRNNVFAVWDARGLTIRTPKRVVGTRLEGYPVSPKLFSRDDILANLDGIAQGRRQRAASALSGAIRIGSQVFFLPRWTDSNGKTWLEALVVVDLSSKDPKVKLLGRFAGTTLAYKPVGDALIALRGRVAAVTRFAGSWQFAYYDLRSHSFESQSCGATLRSYQFSSAGTVLFTEGTAYGTTIAGQADPSSGFRRTIYEGGGTARFLDARLPAIVLASGPNGRVLYSGVSGSEIPLGRNSQVRRAGQAVLVYAPGEHPTSADLLDPSRWSALGHWQEGRSDRLPKRPRAHLMPGGSPQHGMRAPGRPP